MRNSAEKIDPGDYILSVLSPTDLEPKNPWTLLSNLLDIYP